MRLSTGRGHYRSLRRPIGKGNFRHFMEKEIHEQDEVVGYTLRGLMDGLSSDLERPALPAMSFNPKDLSVLWPVALPFTPVRSVNTGSNAWQGSGRMRPRLRVPVPRTGLPDGGMVLAISQSGDPGHYRSPNSARPRPEQQASSTCRKVPSRGPVHCATKAGLRSVSPLPRHYDPLAALQCSLSPWGWNAAR